METQKTEHGNIKYYSDKNTDVIYCENSTRSYPMHTHASHITVGYIMEGTVRLVCNGREGLCRAGEAFYIMPDISHAIEPADDSAYTMLSVCIPVDKAIDEMVGQADVSYIKKLRQIILNAPENVFLIRDMAKDMCVSPYHMIRQFKICCGLTPHQFQLQCRIRKAQKLLEKGESVTRVAHATGFCDQSHFDRCFHKIVRLTPNEYKRAAGLRV